MSAASSTRRNAERSARIASILRRTGLGTLALARVVPLEETLYRAIDPMTLRAPDVFVGGILVSIVDACLMRRRAYAARAFLARRLARMAEHAGFAAAWAGSAREDLYKFRLYTRAIRQARGQQ